MAPFCLKYQDHLIYSVHGDIWLFLFSPFHSILQVWTWLNYASMLCNVSHASYCLIRFYQIISLLFSTRFLRPPERRKPKSTISTLNRDVSLDWTADLALTWMSFKLVTIQWVSMGKNCRPLCHLSSILVSYYQPVTRYWLKLFTEI